MSLALSTPLNAARAWLTDRLEDGVRCPLCTQHAQIYKRRLNRGMARSLVKMYRAAGLDWQHIPTTVGGKSREEAKLRYWGIIEPSSETREDGGKTGVWRVTSFGERFVRGEVRVLSHARVYDGRMLGLEGEPIGIGDALRFRFSLRDLLEGR